MGSAFVPIGMGGKVACGLGSALLFFACGDDSAGSDAGAADAQTMCATNEHCDDGDFCSGVETCDPTSDSANARGCVPASAPCMDGQRCVEATDRCITECDLTNDADGDAVPAIECGGVDCDDADPRRYPGRLEVCDPVGHDEDCDATTFGTRDLDADGHVSSACFNVDDAGTMFAGEDCDDARASVYPEGPEACDTFDNDCDATIDEDVTVAGFHDADADGDGDPARPTDACPGAVRFALTGTDCDESVVSINGRQVEICDAIDNDCDEIVDENPRAVTWYRDEDGDLYGRRGSATAGDAVVSCTVVPGYSLLPSDCDDSRMEISPARAEECNGRDDDCNGSLDFVIAAGDTEDDDADRSGDAVCPVGSNDCNDRDPLSSGDAIELCDDLTDNDCDGAIDEAMDAVDWYFDVDGDGYSDGTGTTVSSCGYQAGYSYRLGDCDDSAPLRHPGAHDGCDRVDQDCDGRLDEDVPARAYYRDADSDGAGVESDVVFACDGAPSGYAELPLDCAPADASTDVAYADTDRDGFGVARPLDRCTGAATELAVAGDCDDADAEVNPDAAELCNGDDDDCDASVDETGGMGCPPGAMWACDSGACDFMGCLAGHEDCDSLPENGCDDTMTSTTHCGGCGGDVCGAGGGCVAGACSTDVVEVRASQTATCARRANGNVVCWGDSVDGVPVLEPRSVYIAGAERVFMGEVGVCAEIGGSFQCRVERGRLTHGFGLGFETGATALPLTPLRAAGLTDIAIGAFHGCGIVGPDGTVVCWGSNSRGQLGDGTTTFRPEPVGVLTLRDAVDIAVGAEFSCAVLASGEVRCWGGNGGSELGDGTTLNSDRPVTVLLAGTAADPAEEVVAGYGNACARRRSGAVDCWGNTAGIGVDGSRRPPSRVITASGDLTGVVELSANEAGSPACARTSSGEAWCWGSPGRALGDGTTTSGVRAVRVLVSTGVPLAGVVSVSTAYQHRCAVVADGSVYCWGDGLNKLGLRRSDTVLFATRLGSLP